MKDLFTTTEAARICGMSKQKLSNLFDEGKIEGFRIPAPGGSNAGARRIPREALLKFMRANGISEEALSVHERVERKKVLIVEDDRFSLELLEAIFAGESERLELRSVTSGAEAAVLAGAWSPDLIVLDLALPDLDGDAVLRAIRKVPELSGTKILVVTAFSDDETRKRMLAMGVHAFLGKPVQPTVLHATAFRLLKLP